MGTKRGEILAARPDHPSHFPAEVRAIAGKHVCANTLASSQERSRLQPFCH
ncbi:MAG: hypothetical protein JRJ12_03605 [Deltaproteobacteria bacterium]|nr:hypothetical protein [Deltaproteobacteria bacterium]